MHWDRDRGAGLVDLTLCEAQLRQTWLRFTAPLTRRAVCLFGLVELAAQTVQLALLVEGVRDGGLRRGFQQACARALRFAERVSPSAAQPHDLGAMNEALPSERHEVRLRVTPSAQRFGPLARTAKVEESLTSLDHGAVHNSRNEGRDLARSDRQHCIVQRRDALDRKTEPE